MKSNSLISCQVLPNFQWKISKVLNQYYIQHNNVRLLLMFNSTLILEVGRHTHGAGSRWRFVLTVVLWPMASKRRTAKRSCKDQNILQNVSQIRNSIHLQLNTFLNVILIEENPVRNFFLKKKKFPSWFVGFSWEAERSTRWKTHARVLHELIPCVGPIHHRFLQACKSI